MIIIQSETIVSAAKQAYLQLYERMPNENDPSIFREDPAAIHVLHPDRQESAFELHENALTYIGDYQKFYPETEKDLTLVEQSHFTDILLDTGHIDTISNHLIQYPDSRRGIISTWLPKYLLEPKLSGVCVTQLYFRMKNNRLEVHSHSRANDAYRLLLMDMQLATWAQQEVAKRISVEIGGYVHFVDSLQFYTKDREAIDVQYDYILNSPVWQ